MQIGIHGTPEQQIWQPPGSPIELQGGSLSGDWRVAVTVPFSEISHGEISGTPSVGGPLSHVMKSSREKGQILSLAFRGGEMLNVAEHKAGEAKLDLASARNKLVHKTFAM